MGVFSLYDDVATVDFGDGIILRFVSEEHPRVKKFVQSHFKRYRAYYNGGGDIPPEITQEFEVGKAAAALEGWEGDAMVEQDGKPIAFSPENAKRLMTAVPLIRRELTDLMKGRAAFRRREVTELGKDSTTLSEPT